MCDNRILFLLAETKYFTSEDESSEWSDIFDDITELSEEDLEGTEDNDDTLFFPLMHYLNRLRKKRVDDYLHIIDSWSDLKFKNRLGLTKKTANLLIEELEHSGFIASHKFGVKPLEAKLCFYIFLSFISTTETLTPIATKFDISLSSTFRVIRRVIAWILTKLDDVIKWPSGHDKVEAICDAFEAKTGISNMMGVIDCMHIKIEKPKNTREYCNVKGQYSIILQATVDADLRFTNIYCGEPGSTNCFRVLKKSPLYIAASPDPTALFPNNTFVIGHSGYPSLTWLIPPYRENKKLTPQQKEFNQMHCDARKLGRKALRAVKVRFKRIQCFSVYRNIDFIIDSVVAACVLHNYCVKENDCISICEKLDDEE